MKQVSDRIESKLQRKKLLGFRHLQAASNGKTEASQAVELFTKRGGETVDEKRIELTPAKLLGFRNLTDVASSADLQHSSKMAFNKIGEVRDQGPRRSKEGK